eukprot:352476-Chlamydomonas_euryale.AAC.25
MGGQRLKMCSRRGRCADVPSARGVSMCRTVPRIVRGSSASLRRRNQTWRDNCQEGAAATNKSEVLSSSCVAPRAQIDSIATAATVTRRTQRPPCRVARCTPRGLGLGGDRPSGAQARDEAHRISGLMHKPGERMKSGKQAWCHAWLVDAWLVDAWAHGCMSARMHVLVDAWAHGCMGSCMHNAWMHGIVHAPARGCMGSWMHGLVDAWTRGCMGAWVHGLMDGWAREWMGSWMHGLVGAWAGRCMGSWMHGFADAWAHGWMGP